MSQTAAQHVQSIPAAANGLGVASFICSLVGLVSCGLLSPIGLLLSIPALFIRPRGFAIAGLVLGLIGSFWLLVAVIFSSMIFGFLAIAMAAIGAEGLEAGVEMAKIATRVNAVERKTHALPADLASVPGIRKEALVDPWGNPYRYVVGADGKSFTITCDGADGKPETADDIRLSW